MATDIANGREIASKLGKTTPSNWVSGTNYLCPAKYGNAIGTKATGSLVTTYTGNTHFIWTTTGSNKSDGRLLTLNDFYKIATATLSETGITLNASSGASGYTTITYTGVLSAPTVTNKPSWVVTGYTSSTGKFTVTANSQNLTTNLKSGTITIKFADVLSSKSLSVVQRGAQCCSFNTVCTVPCSLSQSNNATGSTSSFVGGNTTGNNTVNFNPNLEVIKFNAVITKANSCSETLPCHGATSAGECEWNHLWLDLCTKTNGSGQPVNIGSSFYHTYASESCSPTSTVKSYAFAVPTSTITNNSFYQTNSYVYGIFWCGSDWGHVSKYFTGGFIKFQAGNY